MGKGYHFGGHLEIPLIWGIQKTRRPGEFLVWRNIPILCPALCTHRYDGL